MHEKIEQQEPAYAHLLVVILSAACYNRVEARWVNPSLFWVKYPTITSTGQ